MTTHPETCPENPSAPSSDNPHFFSYDPTPKTGTPVGQPTLISQNSARGLIASGTKSSAGVSSEILPAKTVGVCGSIFTLVQATLGAGIITLPYAVFVNGLILGSVLILGAALLSYYTGTLLVSFLL